MPRRTPVAHLLTVMLAGSAVAMIFGAWDKEHPALYRLALGVALFAGTGLMVIRTSLSERAIERARQEGYFAGFAAAREMKGTAVIPMRSTDRARPVHDPAAQLLDEREVTDTA